MPHDVSNSHDTIDIRDVIARIEELEDTLESATEEGVSEAESDHVTNLDDEKAELRTLQALMDECRGNGGGEQWRGDWFPITLIRDCYFTEAMRELCEDIGDFPKGFPSYMVIDWEATAENLKVDYTAVEFDGVTYWVR